jgi:hypothetical protein
MDVCESKRAALKCAADSGTNLFDGSQNGAALVALRIRFRPGHAPGMVSREYLPVSPMTLPCPTCGAKTGLDCEKQPEVRHVVIHVARVKAAAKHP